MPTVRDDSRFPMVVLRPTGVASNAEIDETIAFLGKQLERKQAFVVLYDLTDKDTSLSPSQRRTYADWLNANDEALRLYLRGTAIASSSVMVRGGITAIFWFYSPPFAYHVGSNVAAAEAWLVQRLDSAARAAT